MYLFFSWHCQQCLKEATVRRASQIHTICRNAIDVERLCYLQQFNMKALLNLKSRNVHQFRKITPGVHTAFTRLLLNKGLVENRMFTSQVLKVVMRAARVRYFILGSAGAGAFGAKLVSYT